MPDQTVSGAPGGKPGARILVVDDDVMLGSALRVILERSGYAAAAVRNGREALARLRQHPANLVISDIFMPDCDGIELLNALRRFHPRPRLLAMTGGGTCAQPDMLGVARLLGADGTIRKPFEPAQLLRLVGELLAESKSSPPARPAANRDPDVR